MKSLGDDLKKINIPLTIIRSDKFSDNANKILDIVNERSISNVYWNNMFGEDENNRDRKVRTILNDHNIFYETFDDQVVYSPGTIKTNEDKPYSVFTPFKRKWIENFNIDLLDIEFSYTPKNNSGINSNINEFNFEFEKSHYVDMSLWGIGEAYAMTKLNDYLDKKIIQIF